MSRTTSPLSNQQELLYVETTSDEAVELIENLTRVESARRLLGDCSLEFDDIGKTLQDLRELERDLRNKMRKTVLQPDPIRVSKHLAKRIREQIETENGGSL